MPRRSQRKGNPPLVPRLPGHFYAVETPALDSTKSQIIELRMVAFACDEDGG